ncbi:hypothetical protein ACH5RR_008381 [Cinchona calisaya]|uniref:Uncharacterized protein n=1 Tax=Cinchona calisaya TaxID=153742 RepID=A0ABD3ABL5_9GENT
MVNTMIVEVKTIEPLESRNQDVFKETGEIHSIKTLGTNKNGTNANKKKQKGRKKNKEGQETSTGSSTGVVQRNLAKEKAVMTCRDEQRQITHSLSNGATIGENVQFPIEGSSSEKTSSSIKNSKRLPGKVTIMAVEVESDVREKLIKNNGKKSKKSFRSHG